MLDQIKKFFALHDDIVALLVLIVGAVLAMFHHSDEAKLVLGGGLALLKGKSSDTNGQ